MSARESALNRCPACGATFRTLADEVGTHPCPRCGWFVDQGDPDEYHDRRRWDPLW